MTRYTKPGDGTKLDTFDGLHTVLAGAEHTGGLYEVFEVDAPQAPPTPLHRTPWAKTFYLLDGRLRVQVEQDTFDLEPGASITIPSGAVHTFTVLTPTTRFLAFATGDGAGKLFTDIVRSVPRDLPMTDAVPRLLEVAQRNGVTFAEAMAR